MSHDYTLKSGEVAVHTYSGGRPENGGRGHVLVLYMPAEIAHQFGDSIPVFDETGWETTLMELCKSHHHAGGVIDVRRGDWISKDCAAQVIGGEGVNA